MQDNQFLLQKLNAPGFHSGTELGNQLGISRVAIKKRIQLMVDKGLPVQAVHGKGYRLEPGVILLEHDRIVDELSKQSVNYLNQLTVLQDVPSTSQFLAGGDFSNGVNVCVAESQTAGRGRRGRYWVSEPYRNVIMSVSWQFPQWPETITGLGLAASLVIGEYLKQYFAIDVQIKWPNDLLVGGAKIAGILVDVSGESGGVCNVVLGLGLNVYQSHSSHDFEYPVQDLVSLGCQVDRNRLIADIINQWLEMLTEFSNTGFASFKLRWNQLSTYQNRRITVSSGDDSYCGVMQGVDALGALLLLGDDGQEHRFMDSAVSVRLL